MLPRCINGWQTLCALLALKALGLILQRPKEVSVAVHVARAVVGCSQASLGIDMYAA